MRPSRRQNGMGRHYLAHFLLGGLLLAMMTMGAGSRAQAQTGRTQGELILEESFRLLMDEEVPLAKRAVFDWGGWFRSSVWDIDNNVDRNFDGHDDGRHVLRRQQLRLWGQFNIDQVHQFYSRGRLDYFDWNHGTSYNHNDSDGDGPDLDRLWYDFQLSRFQKAYGQPPGDFDFSLRLGRQYVRLGTGLALSIPLDALQTGCEWPDWQLTGLWALSTPDAYNIDSSMPHNNEESRRYWAVQLNYKGWRDHEPFVYLFSQQDQDAGSVRLGQTFGYESTYAALGSRGEFFHRDLQYSCEFVTECGKSYAWGPIQNRQNIQAWAFDTELRYVIPDERQSQILVEYLLASGDPDRDLSPTNTVGGNRLHTDDKSFVGWGFRNTGLALAPRISNLSMVRLGASTFPAPHIDIFKELLAGMDFFIYHKQQSKAPMSDSLSTEDSSFVGEAVDLYINWRIIEDMAWTVRYGVFFPGDAFEDKTTRQQFFTGVTFNF